MRGVFQLLRQEEERNVAGVPESAQAVGAQVAGYEHAADVLGDMAPTYFVAVAGLVAAFFGATAWSKK